MERTKINVQAIILVSLLMLISCGKKESPEPVSMLNLVPDDTILFLGGLEPFPLKEFLKWNASHFNMPKDLDLREMVKFGEDMDKEGQRMAVQIWADYYATAMSPETQLESWGFEEKPTLASYTIGLAPVLLRISLKDVQRFNKKIDELEVKAKVKTKPETLGKATYRRYVLNKKEPLVHLIIGVDGNNAVFMLDIGADSQKTLAMALGQNKPAKSLAQGGRLKSLKDKYKLHPSVLGYVDHRQLITGLTTKDGNRMAKMVQALAPQSKDLENHLAELHKEGCRNDLNSIGENWPQTVLGYTALNLKTKPSRFDSIMVVESNDKPLLEGLQSLRGFVPDYAHKAAEPAIASYGIGLNVENIAPFLTKQWTEITQKQYNCAFLKEMQQAVKAQNPVVVGMATSMAVGVRGIAFSLLSLTMDKSEAAKMPMPKDIDAIISLSAKDPAALLQAVSAMVPPLAALQIPADGTPVKLPLPMPLPFTPMAAINGSHLTVYAGDKAEETAKGLRKVSLESSQGFMAADIDYGKYYGLIGQVISSVGGMDAQDAAMLDAMKNARVRLQMDMDFTDRGIEIGADLISMD